jgi:hypothetical protein
MPCKDIPKTSIKDKALLYNSYSLSLWFRHVLGKRHGIVRVYHAIPDREYLRVVKSYSMLNDLLTRTCSSIAFKIKQGNKAKAHGIMNGWSNCTLNEGGMFWGLIVRRDESSPLRKPFNISDDSVYGALVGRAYCSFLLKAGKKVFVREGLGVWKSRVSQQLQWLQCHLFPKDVFMFFIFLSIFMVII